MWLTHYQALAVSEAFGTVFQAFDKALTPKDHRLELPWIQKQIVTFQRIALEIKQVLLAGVAEPDIFEPAIGQEVVGLLLAVAGGVFAMQNGPDLNVLAPKDRDQTGPFDLPGYGHPSQF